MKGIILAGGTGSRLYPLTKVTNKHLLPVGKYPMIFHSVSKLKQADITDILVVTGKDHMGDVVNLLGSGSDMGVSFTYKVQDEAGGIAQALGLAEQFVGDDQVVVILGDNVFADDISPFVANFKKQQTGAKILIQEVHDPKRFGVPELQGDRIVSIEEKPQDPKSNYAVTGIYMFDHRVFEIVKTLKPSARGELEITDVNNAYIERGELTYDVLQGWWTDAGTHASLARANELAKDLVFGEEFGKLKL
ncbi:NTP transferase domain-containing protein [Paenibacillus macerans]|uniref:Glucose-1-phosphate thymidylyltransferase n=1 Tax=Paenibacillus macerans TaxID=44252 RepID=A0A6N8EV82_PAEMA|nr:sugar phosphate nucleotidyltransferase [Paenibacillus macerans]MBS5912941.1 NTP transferase domain-containing protein [Paenibacillus macerans]MUG23779.1 NTP transferase domain-containing protein [Paenibacillus macerans]